MNLEFMSCILYGLKQIHTFKNEKISTYNYSKFSKSIANETNILNKRLSFPLSEEDKKKYIKGFKSIAHHKISYQKLFSEEEVGFKAANKFKYNKERYRNVKFNRFNESHIIKNNNNNDYYSNSENKRKDGLDITNNKSAKINKNDDYSIYVNNTCENNQPSNSIKLTNNNQDIDNANINKNNKKQLIRKFNKSLVETHSSFTESFFENNNLKTKYDAKITEYCPYIFKDLRIEDGIDYNDLLYSLDPISNKQNMLKLKESAGKSGSFFFFSYDKKYIIKTIKDHELKTILGNFIESYYNHVLSNPDSLLTRIYGVYTVDIR